MKISRQLLVVSPATGIDIPRDNLKSLALSLLGLEQNVETSASLVFAKIMLRSALGGVLSQALKTKRDAAQEAMPLLVEMLEKIFKVGPEPQFPGLLLLRDSDERLGKFACPDGTFFPGIIYAAHPARLNYYIRVADFHRRLLDEKRAEFLRLAAALGAKSVSLLDSQSRDNNGNASLGLAGVAGGSVNIGKSTKTNFSLEATFNEPPAHSPRVPKELIWIEHEPQWNAMAVCRTEAWLLSYDVNFDYSNDFGVNAEINALVNGLGMSVGGNFRQFEEVNQVYRVEFFSQKEYASR